MASRLHDATLHKPVQWPQRKRRGAHGSKRYLKGSCMNQHFETSACLPSTICCRKSWHNYIFRTWTHFNVWGPPFLPRTKCFPPTMLGKCVKGAMATNSRGTNQTSILDLHIPFTFDKSLQQPLPPPLYAPPQALPTEEASSQTCADPRQPSMYPICFNNLRTKNGNERNWLS